jgi:hypothetical protein
MIESHELDAVATAELLNPAIIAILRHLCAGECHTFGDVLEWCESRGDCSYAVVCPACKAQFLIEEDDLADLRRWTDTRGMALSCGVRWE